MDSISLKMPVTVKAKLTGGVAEVGRNNRFDGISEGTTSQKAIQQHPASYLRHTHHRFAVPLPRRRLLKKSL